VAGKDIRLVANTYGTDCYPKKKLETLISINDINEAVLFNIRNAYQNYNVAVNLSDKTIYTYMGVLKHNWRTPIIVPPGSSLRCLMTLTIRQ